jgi:hypothetical protein
VTTQDQLAQLEALRATGQISEEWYGKTLRLLRKSESNSNQRPSADTVEIRPVAATASTTA